MSALKVVSSGVCEATVASTHCGAYWSGAVPPGDTGGTWPADQYCELTITAIQATGYVIPMVRCSSGANTQYRAYLETGASHAFLYAIVAGTANLLATFTITFTTGDVWRLSVAGTVLTISQNGSTVQTFTDTNNYVTSGSPGLDIFAPTIASESVSNFAAGANQAATPTFSPVAGTYAGPQTVTISSSTAGGTIYYTTDGSTPTRSSASISNGGTISVASSLTVKAIASVSNFADSQVGTAAYTITASAGQVGAFLVGP
jgi:Chitobiase/beta-hexosaminidase C-terminal domain